LPNSGVADQVKGAAQQTWGKRQRRRPTRPAKTRQQEKQHKADKMRDNVTTSVEDAKNSANDRIADFKDRQRQRRSA
jgi:uncharacterized protein YjbJ (UPF0337 family)